MPADIMGTAGKYFVDIVGIHSKSWFCWFVEFADKFEFSAERLSENAKTIKLGFERWSHHCPSTYESTQPLSQLPRNTCVSRNHSDTMHLKDKCPFFSKKIEFAHLFAHLFPVGFGEPWCLSGFLEGRQRYLCRR